MSTTDEVRRMREEGMNDKQISSELKRKGLSQQEVSSVLSQSQIKEAVSQENPYPEQQEVIGQAPQTPSTQELGQGDMQPSILSSQPQQAQQPLQQQAPQEQPQQAPMQEPPQQEYLPIPAEQQYQDQQYQSYQPTGLSPDTMNEIAEQAITERITPLKDQLEKTLDLKNTMEAQVESLSSRLQRIEKIIDRLQISVLQKVGNYITNVEDIKKELVQTQKTFKAITRKKSSNKP